MGILDIENRTENWKTARYFSPFFKDEAARLRLVRKLGEPNETQASEVCIELFWKVMRDHWEKHHRKTKETVEDRNLDFLKQL